MTLVNVCTLDTCPLEYGMVHYQPSLFGNVFYLGIFAALLIIHIIQLWCWKAWSFSWCMISGLVLEVVGYLGRIQMHYDPFASNPFLIYLICLTIAPVFFTASIYMTYSRIILHYGPHLSRFSPKLTSITFMIADWIALILQATGGAIADTAATKDGMNGGTHILVAGLSFQVLCLVLFIFMVGEYAFVLKGDRTRRQAANWAAGEGNMSSGERKMRYLCYGFTIATILILIRSIFRVAELAKGFQSKLANEEVPFMILEGAVMILATTVMSISHPGLIMTGNWKRVWLGVERMEELRREFKDTTIRPEVPQ